MVLDFGYAFYAWEHLGPLMMICPACILINSEYRSRGHYINRSPEAANMGFPKITSMSKTEELEFIIGTPDSIHVHVSLGINDMVYIKDRLKVGRHTYMFGLSHGMDEDTFHFSGKIDDLPECKQPVHPVNNSEPMLVFSKILHQLRPILHENEINPCKNCTIIFSTLEAVPGIQDAEEFAKLAPNSDVILQYHPLHRSDYEKKSKSSNNRVKITKSEGGLSTPEISSNANVIVGTGGASFVCLVYNFYKPFFYWHPYASNDLRKEAEKKGKCPLTNDFVSVFTKINKEIYQEGLKKTDKDTLKRKQDWICKRHGSLPNGYEEYVLMMSILNQVAEKEKNIGLKEDIEKLLEIYLSFEDVDIPVWDSVSKKQNA